jgi:hypothetical protein
VIFIPLSQGKVAIVDDQDRERVAGYKYHWARGYAVRNVYEDGKWKQPSRKIPLHYDVMGEPPDGKVMDHRNGNTLDNRRKNLRWATPQQNAQNHGLSRRNNSGRTGVFWRERLRKWEVNICGKYIGVFRDKQMAVRVRGRVERLMFGQYSREGSGE